MPTVVFRLAGQDSIGPSDADQSWLAISFAVVPPPARNDALWLPPNHVEIYLATSTMTFQFKKSKLREDAEVPHAVGLKKGMLWTDRPRSSAKCFAWLTEGGRVCRRTRRGRVPVRAAITQEMRPDHEQYHAQWPAAGRLPAAFC